jgi:hypothetical protein
MSERRAESAAARQEHVAAYKTVLRTCLDERPSGARQKIARVLGTHRSFVTQITNPGDPTPIPARHVPLILELVHASDGERRRFVEAYEKAHPNRPLSHEFDRTRLKTVHLEIPMLEDPEAQAALEELIRETVMRLVRIARMQSGDNKPKSGEEPS